MDFRVSSKGRILKAEKRDLDCRSCGQEVEVGGFYMGDLDFNQEGIVCDNCVRGYFPSLRPLRRQGVFWRLDNIEVLEG